MNQQTWTCVELLYYLCQVTISYRCAAICISGRVRIPEAQEHYVMNCHVPESLTILLPKPLWISPDSPTNPAEYLYIVNVIQYRYSMFTFNYLLYFDLLYFDCVLRQFRAPCSLHHPQSPQERILVITMITYYNHYTKTVGRFLLPK